MDPNDEVSGVFDVIATKNHEAPAKPEEHSKETKVTSETTDPKPKKAEGSKSKTEDEPDKPTDTQDFNRDQTASEDESEPEASAPYNSEPAAPAAEDETSASVEEDWKATLPPPPPKSNLTAPEVNEEGQITNMGPAEYQQYLIERVRDEMRQEQYAQAVENRALDAAEKLLPEIRTNPAIRKMVENARVASVINGDQIDSYEAAKQVMDALGISASKLQQAKAEGAQNAKTSITIQKNAAVESKNSGQKKEAPSKIDKLSPRLKRGDDNAFAELFDIWAEEGKI